MPDRSRTANLALGAVLGVLLLAAFRVAVAAPETHPHFHANFAVFVDGARLDLSGDEYMEEVGACSPTGEVLPTDRVHLHNNDPDVVHVHHEGATWGHLFANLGMGLGADYLALDDGPVLVEGGGRTLHLVLNGQPQFEVHNEPIASGDRLLVSFGPQPEDEAVGAQFPRVARNAEEFNQRPDPAGCSGATEPTLWDRVRHAFVG